MNIQASYRTFICLVEGASLCVLAIRPGVSLWLDEANLTPAGILQRRACPIRLFDLPVWPWGVLKILRDFVIVWF